VSGMRDPNSVDWDQAPWWARWYCKDESTPSWDHIPRCTWRETQPMFHPSSPYGQWGGRGMCVDAPDFGAGDDWGLVERP
jgi:hypothetical protein